MTTLKDIAQKAGVSVMTVSRVINGHYTKVSKEKTQLIQNIIKESGYVVNSNARSLSSKSSKIIAVLLQGDKGVLKDPYISAMVNGIIENVQEHGYYLMLHYVQNYEDITTRIRSWNVEGAIFLGTFDENIKQIQEDNNIPLIFTDSYTPMRRILNVGIDDYKGGVLAAKYFIEHGHKSFAFAGYSPNSSSVMRYRLKGFTDRLNESGFTLSPEHILNLSSQKTAELISEFKEPVSAIFVAADIAAIGIIDDLGNMGYNIPRDYSFIGFDDLSVSYFANPKLTTIFQDIDLKAKTTCDILFRHIENSNIPTENVCLDVKLIERQSVSFIKD